MAVYMIDYENVKTGGLNGISRLTDADRVIIFYSENANRLTFDLHQRLMASTAQIEYREVSVGGHNALDFQLVTYLGFLIAKEPKGQYLIISNDRGFEYVVNFWRKDGLSIGLLPYLKDPAYALQKATRFDAKPVSAPAEAAAAEEAISDMVAEQVDEQVDEPETAVVPEEVPAVAIAAEAAAEVLPKEEAAEPSVETVFEETVSIPAPPAEEPVAVKTAEATAEAAAGKAVEEASKTVAATPVEILPERRKAARPRKKQGNAIDAAAPEKAAQVAAKEVAAKQNPPKQNAPKQTAPKKQDKPKDEPKDKPMENRKQPQAEEVQPVVNLSVQARTELRALLGDSVADDPELRFVMGCVEKYKTKLGLNNALVKRFGNQKASEIYQKLKPMLSAKKTNTAAKQKNNTTAEPEKAGVS